jgi:mannose-6-phosphate isomerase-like protein (cupin superfamily)
MEIKHVDKGWGYEKWIVNKEEYCGKLLFFNKDKRCSWHYHKIKDEVFYLQSGK